MFRLLLLLVAVSSSTVFAQGANSIASAGYSFSGATPVAPGQVISLFVPSLNVSDAKATKTPWPTSLSGVSVVVPNPPNPAYPTALPILSLSSYLCQGTATQFCPKVISVQVPYEPTCIRNQIDDCMFGPFGSLVQIAVQVNGVTGQGFLLSPAAGLHPHFLNSCDTIFGTGGSCLQQITHADGSLVGGVALPGVTPAHPGESIAIYAVGLGPTAHAKTGQAVTTPDPVSYDVYLTPAVLTGLGTFLPFKGGATMEFGAPIKADWAGLIPDFLGLYQINVKLPATLPSGAAGCNGSEAGNVRLFWGNILNQDTVNSVPFVDVCVANN